MVVKKNTRLIRRKALFDYVQGKHQKPRPSNCENEYKTIGYLVAARKKRRWFAVNRNFKNLFSLNKILLNK